MPQKDIRPQKPEGSKPRDERVPAPRVTLLRRLKKLSRRIACNHTEIWL